MAVSSVILELVAKVLDKVSHGINEYLMEENVKNELVSMLGKEFVEHCLLDDVCKATITDIARTSLMYEESMSPDERRESRNKILKLLKIKLYELGISFHCEEIDLGELGSFYTDCYILYAGERFSIKEVKT